MSRLDWNRRFLCLFNGSITCMDLYKMEEQINDLKTVTLISIRNNEVFINRILTDYQDFIKFVDYLHRSSESSRIADS